LSIFFKISGPAGAAVGGVIGSIFGGILGAFGCSFAGGKIAETLAEEERDGDA